MAVSVFYRTYNGENNLSCRPNWYSKEICLKSMLASYELLCQEAKANFTLMVDGYLNINDKWSKNLKETIEPLGSIIELPRKGNSGMALGAVFQAINEPEDNIVILSEDDYFWLKPALVEMYRALTQLPIHYATPYDHPVRYQPNYPLGADCPHWHNSIYITTNRHWRTQESTCMTFASTARVLLEDVHYFEKHQDNERGKPNDRELFREIQGLGNYPPRTRILVGPIPSLSTHAHLPWLSPIINWEEEVRNLWL